MYHTDVAYLKWVNDHYWLVKRYWHEPDHVGSAEFILDASPLETGDLVQVQCGDRPFTLAVLEARRDSERGYIVEVL